MEDILDAPSRMALVQELSDRLEKRKESAKAKIGGLRNLLTTCPLVAEIALQPRLISILSRLARLQVFPVRAIFFDKTSESNWSVPWHQDLAICVRERIDTPRFGGWSVKDGENHVHPPAEVLAGMITARLHLNECNEQNGPLQVMPRSHAAGKLGAAAIRKWTESVEPIVCRVAAGGALFMRPLLLHSSNRADDPSHRRVLHLEYATSELPNGLQWKGRL